MRPLVYMFEWLGIYVVAESDEKAQEFIVARYVDESASESASTLAWDRSGRYFGPEGRVRSPSEHYLGEDPWQYMHRVRPDEVLEIPDMELSYSDETVHDSIGALLSTPNVTVAGGFTSTIHAEASLWEAILPDGWMWDPEDQ